MNAGIQIHTENKSNRASQKQVDYIYELSYQVLAPVYENIWCSVIPQRTLWKNQRKRKHNDRKTVIKCACTKHRAERLIEALEKEIATNPLTPAQLRQRQAAKKRMETMQTALPQRKKSRTKQG